MNPNDWLKKFLSEKGLSAPTGKSLYTYKIKMAEYLTLLETLKKHRPDTPKWDACFVLFASEWWRREYTGGPWTWDTILNLIQKRGMAISERTSTVQSGLIKWGRKLNIGGRGNDYIGTIVIECGLPLKLLENEHYLPDLITNIYTEIGSISSIEQEYIDIVRSMAEQRLPETLQKDAFLFLLLEFVQALTTLTGKKTITNIQNPESFLEGLDSDLRDAFPVRLDNTIGKSFISKLLIGVKKIQTTRVSMITAAQELLNSEGEWRLRSSLEIKAGIHHIAGLGISAARFRTLSVKLEMYIGSGYDDRRIGYAFKKPDLEGFYIAGPEKLAVQNTGKWSLYLLDPKTGERIILKAANEDICFYSEPLIFDQKENNQQYTWKFITSGSAKLKQRNYYVLIGNDARLEGNSWKRLAETGIGTPGKVLYEINGDCEIINETNTYQLTFTDQTEHLYYEFMHTGKMLDFFTDDNKDIFTGWPNIVKYGDNGEFVGQIRAGIEYLKGNRWEKADSSIHGKVKIRLLNDQKTMFCRWINLLPIDFSISFNPSEKTVVLAGAQKFYSTVYCEAPSSQYQNSGVLFIRFNDLQASLPLPTFFKLVLQDKEGSFSPIEIKVPYPRQDICFYDAANAKIGQKSALYIHNLYGVRLLVNNLSSTTIRVPLKLLLEDHFGQDVIAISRLLNVPAFGNLEFNVISLKENLLAMFAATTNIDASIRLSCNNQESVDLRLFDYGRPYFESDTLIIDDRPCELDVPFVCGLRLDQDFDENHRITLDYVHEKHAWSLPTEKGVWILYPPANAGRSFRPICYKNIDEGERSRRTHFRHFYQAALLPRQERLPALSEVISWMFMNFRHSDWDQLEILYQEIKHMPLNTLDIFTALTNHTFAMPAAAFRLTEQLLERLSADFCIIWFQYPIATWVECLKNYKEFLLMCFPAMASQLIEAKLNWIGDGLGLSSVRWILEKEVLRIHDEYSLSEVKIKLMIEQLLHGSDQQPGLRGRHAHNQRWPDQLEQEINSFYKDLPSALRALVPEVVIPNQRSAVYLPFILAASSLQPENTKFADMTSFEKFKVKELIEFDEEWFLSVYNLLQPYLRTITTAKKIL